MILMSFTQTLQLTVQTLVRAFIIEIYKYQMDDLSEIHPHYDIFLPQSPFL